VKVVSDTSPLLNLAIISQLDLLHELYERILIPQAVYDELVSTGSDMPGADEVEAASDSWITVYQVKNQPLVKSLELQLDKGESEAIALAIEMSADLVLLDERKGRTVALRFDLNHIGLLGMLMEAKHRGLIPSVKPLLDALMHKARFRVSSALYVHILETVGE